jgi:PAS domain S-box-containing protein
MRPTRKSLTAIKAEFDGKSDSGSDVLYRRKDGSEFWTAMFISPVRDERGDVVQYFASFADLMACHSYGIFALTLHHRR